MNRHQRRAAMAVAASAGFLAVGVGPADALPFTVSSTGGIESQTLSFAKFDPALGTLTGVVFTLSSLSTSVAGTLQLTGPEGGTASAFVSASFSLLAPGDGGPLDTLVMSADDQVDLSCAGGNGPDACSDTDTSTTLDTTFINPGTIVDLLDLANFLGIGTFDVKLELSVLSAVDTCVGANSASATCTIDPEVSWTGDLAVDYLFDAIEPPPGGGDVPEPGALLFLALGLPALARLRRSA